MNKLVVALTASMLSAPAFAGTYVNVESNASYTGNDYTSRKTDLHIGYEGEVGQLGYYVQGGPSFSAADGVDGSTDFSGKLGGSVQASDKLGIYGEISFVSDETADTAYGTKVGAKFKF